MLNHQPNPHHIFQEGFQTWVVAALAFLCNDGQPLWYSEDYTAS